MQNLIKDLLDFSKLSQTGQSFVKVDLNDVLQNIRNDFELLAQQKNATIEIGHMPVIEAVGLQMQQLFYNLVSNALKFVRSDVQPVISVQASLLTAEEMEQHAELNPRLKHYCIAVRDNGIGFNQKYAEQIFVIFQRLNDIQSYSGTGIGLALCKKIVLNHGGKIFAESTEHEGAVFYIILPEEHVIVTA
jgi:two-component system CheB/CheR fusion protein